MCRVSVIIPTYNRAAMVYDAVQSVLQQSYTDFEIIVVDDGSTDDTAERLQGLISTSDKIRYMYQPNQGRSSARNQGIQQARGEYLSFLDSDDCYLPGKLERQVKILDEHPDCAMSFTNYRVMDEHGVILDRYGEPDIDLNGNIYPDLLFFKGTVITTPAVMVRALVLNEVGRFDEGMHICEDLDLWRRIARKSRVLQIKEPMVVIRYRTGEVTDWWKNLTGRKAYYAKAFLEDAGLDGELKKSLYTEMYSEYGWVGLQKKAWRFALHCFWLYALTNPLHIFSRIKSYARRRFARLIVKIFQLWGNGML